MKQDCEGCVCTWSRKISSEPRFNHNMLNKEAFDARKILPITNISADKVNILHVSNQVGKDLAYLGNQIFPPH
jgi:hypothetical protein